MSFRARLALVAAGAVALAVVAASVVVFVVVHGQLLGQVDTALRARAQDLVQPGPGQAHIDDGYLDVPGPGFGTVTDYTQAVPVRGRPLLTRAESQVPLPVSDRARRAATGEGKPFFSHVHVSGVDWRVYTVPFPGLALQVARPLTEVNRTLHRITVYLIVIAAGGILVAAALGLAVSQAALRPVRRLTKTTENVTETGDLSQRIEAAGGQDELGRLAASFNTMLGALEESSRAQRQLVADASHELRTPLTSLRTNIEVLAGEHSLASDERERLLGDVVEQLGEMTTLIAELIELARAEQHLEEPQDLRLDRIGRLSALEELEVRAEAGERSAQLVRRVGDELALRAQRRLELSEHGIEARAEPAELVTALRRDPT